VTGDSVQARTYGELLYGPAEPQWLTKDEAAQRARCSKRTIERAVRRGELRFGACAGGMRFRPEWVDDWIIRSGRGFEDA
jgi:excisionase family DNA binding protein